ncbi:urease accessory protein UreE [Sulfuracidifex tepidarius]|uniref:Urease accessory protein UreE n=1 Tax=Sulfuracidifex tepidarius TaxID=1294262 RepID=A0A510E5Q1_9CREN|nr:hypothetical protein [Sulfuracidifex tepidarius]BBG25081.1 Urease accessory protein UreE [Sulfuracidifex tepidarius]BBG27863.1 Urease accessory protein UreE [Sulfuracidifex tepidarius]
MRVVKSLGVIPHDGAITVEADREVFERARRWRLNSEKGEVILDLGRAPRDGEVFETDTGDKVVLVQKEEPVLVFSLSDPKSSFVLGYKLGNLHQNVMLVDDKVMIPKKFPDEYYRNVLEGTEFSQGRAKFTPNVNKVEE